MIIVRLLGGLGNQLFQYATARRLAIATSSPLKMDTSAFESYPLRKYELGHFSIQAEMASASEIARLRRPGVLRALRRVLGRPYSGPQIDEIHFEFDRRVLDVRAPAYLTGYWQSERYFADVAGVLRRELSLRDPVSPRSSAVEKVISSVESISLHVRRGDYVANSRTNRTHGICSLEYYAAALGEVRSRVPHGHVFVFSDDPDWVRANLRLEGPCEYVDHNDAERAHEDLHLISRCRHHIIANSTFSWWGAWLASSPTQIVVAPRRWFASRNERARDVCPQRWLRV